MNRLLAFLNRPAGLGLAAAVVGIAVIGTVVVTITPAGCRLGMHGTACDSTVAVVTSPSPTHFQTATPRLTILPSPTSESTPFPSPPVTPTPAPVLPPFYYQASQAAPPEYYQIASGPAPASLGLNCRLPIFGGPGGGGFISFPGGTFTADPRSAVILPSPPISYPPPQGGSYSSSMFGLTYDQAVDQWLPVRWRWVAPDGMHYAFTYNGGEGIIVVDVKSGARRELGQGYIWHLLDVESTGVYAAVGFPGQQQPGMWWLPFSGTGSLSSGSLITGADYWQGVSAGFAYGSEFIGAPTIIKQLDLKTGAESRLFEVEGSQSTVVGFDAAGHPLIVSSNIAGVSELWFAPGLGTAQIVGALNVQYEDWYNMITDSHGIWISGVDAIYLMIPGKAKWTVALINTQLAGGCQ